MTRHLQRDLAQLGDRMLRLGAMVERAIETATRALAERRSDLAAEVLRGDDDIDRQEVAIEEECLKILALHQPVASDLRYIVAALKVNNDLERMGDLAGNIASRAEELCRHPGFPMPPQFTTMIATVRSMVHDSLDALVRTDVATARRVLAADDVVDRIHRQMFVDMQARARETPDDLEAPTSWLSVSRYLERIADQCTNIAEDVVFLVEGEIVRHRRSR